MCENLHLIYDMLQATRKLEIAKEEIHYVKKKRRT